MIHPDTGQHNDAHLGRWQRVMLPRPGRKFVFDVCPGASYATAGEVYVCSYAPDIFKGVGDIALSNVGRNTGCYDRISAWEHAVWRYVS